MPDCDNPKCHEFVVTELNKKATWDRLAKLAKLVEMRVPKTWLWLGFVFIGLPLIIVAGGVWNGQMSDPLRYASKAEVMANQLRITSLEETGRYLRRDIDEIKANTNEVLKLVRRASGIYHNNTHSNVGKANGRDD